MVTARLEVLLVVTLSAPLSNSKVEFIVIEPTYVGEICRLRMLCLGASLLI